jgi:hypothetical protein
MQLIIVEMFLSLVLVLPEVYTLDRRVHCDKERSLTFISAERWHVVLFRSVHLRAAQYGTRTWVVFTSRPLRFLPLDGGGVLLSLRKSLQRH